MAIVPNFILAAKLLSGADSIRQGDLLDYTLSRSLLIPRIPHSDSLPLTLTFSFSAYVVIIVVFQL